MDNSDIEAAQINNKTKIKCLKTLQHSSTFIDNATSITLTEISAGLLQTKLLSTAEDVTVAPLHFVVRIFEKKCIDSDYWATDENVPTF